MGDDPKAADDQNVAAALGLLFVVGTPVKQVALHGAEIFRPLPLQVDQGPLAAAEGEVLKAGQGEVVLLRQGAHPMRVQVTPAGRAASSTATV